MTIPWIHVIWVTRLVITRRYSGRPDWAYGVLVIGYISYFQLPCYLCCFWMQTRKVTKPCWCWVWGVGDLVGVLEQEWGTKADVNFCTSRVMPGQNFVDLTLVCRFWCRRYNWPGSMLTHNSSMLVGQNDSQTSGADPINNFCVALRCS